LAEGRYTRQLDGLRSADASRFGGKSASLGELIAGEIPVPAGFAVSSDAYLDALEAAGGGEGADPPPLPPELRAELAEGYERLAAAAGDPQLPVAVRSSALGEDAEGATFAGQHETYLWIRGAEGVCDALRDCWGSLYSSEAVSYRADMGGSGPGTDREFPAMGVTVQTMVDAEISGVMFTCNPVSGDPSTIAVNASWGLGLGVVGGEVTPDEYRISKVTKEVLRREIGAKQLEFVPDPGGSGTTSVEVAAERRAAACLSDPQLETLVELAKKVERHFGGHQDVEWAISRGDGRLALLQSRPVTTLPDKDSERKPAPRSAIDMVMGTFGADKGSRG
jgi:phosphoenolpyruvate synthase/pyruvate phosphate dikinase